MKTFYTLMLDVALIVGTVGYVAPFLISLPNTLAVAAGIFLTAIILPTALYYINRNLVKRVIADLKDY